MTRNDIESGNAVLGIEFGSTRIKSVLIDNEHRVIASGSHEWENSFLNGVWTYSEQDILSGLQRSYASLKQDVMNRYGVRLTRIGALGISAMMHGYLPFDQNMKLLTPFRTWRNTITEEASQALTERFSFNIPQRWCLSHLYQAILNHEDHIGEIRFFTTLAGWIHFLLTGNKVLGVGDASGMMPIDSTTCDYRQDMVDQFNEMIADCHLPWKLEEILPKVLSAGADAGKLTKAGASLLDPDGELQEGCPCCPPEGDAGTGMVATNSIKPRTGNVSAGTSIFSMIVLEKPLKDLHPEVDIVTTPVGDQVAMVHCNSCSSDINAWISLFMEFAELMDVPTDKGQVFSRMFSKALEGEKNCDGIISFNYFAGEPVTGLPEGRPMMVRKPDSKLTLGNFMRSLIYSSMSTLKYGMDLLNSENVSIDRVYGHGGLFKTKGVAQSILAAAIHAPVTVMETAGEGGAWGMALLADYMLHYAGISLDEYLTRHVFDSVEQTTVSPDPEDVAGFDLYMKDYIGCLPAEKAAVDGLRI